ncbi:hypothetical protein B0J15DRAFT_457662 [Fusarium solani]|uniref:Uncharacterized protein n=1 Tax=Fusarium solani TaxID=169388 RepID=A0A9P9L7T6_FUSSL|nr:uncharacterized protein B0J15DRAFT_457662 [Fusarium solani]KAH7275493.1 hypothetical protein B0J15DRAFT_457662 [Fusarium solani]
MSSLPTAALFTLVDLFFLLGLPEEVLIEATDSVNPRLFIPYRADSSVRYQVSQMTRLPFHFAPRNSELELACASRGWIPHEKQQSVPMPSKQADSPTAISGDGLYK